MAEWLGSGLQSRLRRFEPARCLVLGHNLRYRTAAQCDCENKCYHCRLYGHSDCWQRVALWRRCWILLKDWVRGEVKNG